MDKRLKIIIIILILSVITIILYKYYNNKYDYNEKPNKYLNNITYKIPNSFEKDTYTYSINYHYHENYVSCNFEVKYFENYNNYKNGEEYLKDNIRFTLNDNISDIKEVSINNNKWYLLEKENNSYKNYYYATIYNGIGYYMEYEIYDFDHGDHEGNSNFCNTSYDKIISSVKFK
ncbi:MAG: hypothetical protein IKF19_06785 [Bacilli bacterium]|nr:hypothetical protein [Bacilli bacterium]